jgi:WD40 repeat protein
MVVPQTPGRAVFISHADADGPDVPARLRDALTAAGIRPVGDWDLRPGDRWADELERYIRKASGAVVVIGQAALKSQTMAKELTQLLVQATERPDFRCTTLILPDVTLTDLEVTPFSRLLETWISSAATVDERIGEIVAAFAPTASSNAISTPGIPFTSTYRLDAGEAVASLTVSTFDGKATIVAALEDRTVRTWDLANGQSGKTLASPHDDVIWSIAADGQFLVSGGQDANVWAWNADGTSSTVVARHERSVNSVAIGVLNGRRIVASGGDDDVVRLSTETSQMMVLNGHSGWVNGVTLGAIGDGLVAVSASSDKTVRVWDVKTGRERMLLAGHADSVSSVAFGMLADLPIAASGSIDRTVRVWDLRAGAAIAVFTGHTQGVRAVAIADIDGRTVVVSGADDHTVRLWDVAANHEYGPPLVGHTGPVRTVAVGSVSGMPVVVSGSDDATVRIWTSAGDYLEWLSDSTSEADYLKRKPLASVLAQRLQRQHEREPGTSFLIHVDGAWGTGKSTLLDYLRAELDQRDWVTIQFDAWREAELGPPWWALLAALRLGICQHRGLLGRVWLRTVETFTRLRRSGASFVFACAVLLAISAAVFFLLRPSGLTAESVTALAKTVTAVVAALGTLSAGAVVAARLLLWDSARGARLYEQSNANPMGDVARHFHWLTKKARGPVVFLIDDLDRCPQTYVVALLEAVQTLIRGKGAAPDMVAASFVVAADGAWIRTSFEIEYERFAPTITEAGRPLGYLFLDKLFQLHVPVPTIDPPRMRTYLNHLLGLRTGHQLASEVANVRARLERSTSEAQIVTTLGQASAEVRDQVVVDAVRALGTPDITAATEHHLQRYGSLLPPNPRSMKLFLNSYTMLRTIRTLEGNPVPITWLALWTVIETRWPSLADHLRAQPEHIALVGDAKQDLSTVPADLRPLFTDPTVRRTVEFDAQYPLTPDAVRSCTGGS